MKALFVHGMGRTPVSGWPMLWHLKRHGLNVTTFRYSTVREDFEGIKRRLVSRLSLFSGQGGYILIGHSLGGLLLMEALAAMQPGVKGPEYLFLLGTPLHASALARHFRNNWVYQRITGDCGQLLGSDLRMEALHPTVVPTVAIVGTLGLSWKAGPFHGELNDGVVSISEVSAVWLQNLVRVHTVHTMLPASKKVSNVILETLGHKRLAS